jgi:predicted nicotinamide N-methyase
VTTTTHQKIGAYAATLTRVDVGSGGVALWQVTNLERHVDRVALLTADDAADPPYWAYLWSGARVLADAVPLRAGRVVELGCGLGLPGLVAACRGATVVFVDREATALAFVRASARANGLAAAGCVVADFSTPPFHGTFDLVLAAEVVYERATFVPLARALAGLVRPGGRVLLTDGQRMDTRAFYPALEEAGLAWRARRVQVEEEGFPVEVHLVEAWHA